MIDSLSITGLEYGTTFLAIQILADFEIKYLSLPESYDTNFAILCLPTHWSIINIKNISGLCLFWASPTFFLLAIKKYALKRFFKFRLQPQKKNSVVFTYRRRSTPNYYVCCVTSQYFFRIHFFASKRLSECPAYLYNYINLLLSSFFVQMQVVRRSLSLSVKIIYYQVLRDKKKEPAMF